MIYIVDKTKLRRMLESGKYTQSDAARKFKVSRERIRQLVISYGIIYRKPITEYQLKAHIKTQEAALKRLAKWKKQLTYLEKPRLNVDLKIEVRCAKCKQYFIPHRYAIGNRRYALQGKLNSLGTECRLYCSNACKQACSVYNNKGGVPNKTRHARIDQPDLRKMVLERDGYTCIQCGSREALVCHHIVPVVIDPLESADVDNCITLCQECHNKAHTGACSRVNLRCKGI